jgi:hypothetical protein
MKRMFWDIETCPNVVLSWGASWKERLSHHNILEERRIICICWKWEGEEEVHSLDWGKDKCDKKLIQDFMKEANKASELVAHNGDRYDLTWLKTRCLFHRIEAFPKYITIDTLKHCRQSFRFNSNRLDYVAKFLGVGAKMETGGFQLWKDVMNSDVEALDRMIEYCKGDCIILEKVYNELKNYVPHKSHRGVELGGKKWHCVECGSPNVRHRKTYVTVTGVIKRFLSCNGCKKYYAVSDKVYSNFLKEKTT